MRRSMQYKRRPYNRRCCMRPLHHACSSHHEEDCCSRSRLSSLLLLGVGAGAHAQDAKPSDAKAGEKKVAMCIGCHGIPGYQASFPEVHKVPMIAGQGAKYIVAALTAYQKGERKHPTMRAIAGTLSDQDMADLAAFYEQQGKARRRRRRAGRAARPPAEVAELLDAGQLRVVPRRQLQQADRPQLPEARRPACRLPVRRAEGLPDREQPAARPQQRDHGRHGAPFTHAR